MLYSEFLQGTQAPDNRWTFKEYKRIEEIYNNNAITHEEAYKLYQEPDAFTACLLSDYAKVKTDKIYYSIKIDNLTKELEAVKAELEKEQRLRRSIQETINQAAKEAHDLYYLLND